MKAVPPETEAVPACTGAVPAEKAADLRRGGRATPKAGKASETASMSSRSSADGSTATCSQWYLSSVHSLRLICTCDDERERGISPRRVSVWIAERQDCSAPCTTVRPLGQESTGASQSCGRAGTADRERGNVCKRLVQPHGRYAHVVARDLRSDQNLRPQVNVWLPLPALLLLQLEQVAEQLSVLALQHNAHLELILHYHIVAVLFASHFEPERSALHQPWRLCHRIPSMLRGNPLHRISGEKIPCFLRSSEASMEGWREVGGSEQELCGWCCCEENKKHSTQHPPPRHAALASPHAQPPVRGGTIVATEPRAKELRNAFETDA
eukprot:3050128-Rhodomonas_salina.7